MNPSLISSPLPGEHLATTWPTPKPETAANAPLRLRYWAGRALAAEALELEQESRAARLVWRGRVMSAGIVAGLEVSLEAPASPPHPLTMAGHFLHLSPGFGITASGEDVMVPRPLRVALDAIPVHPEGTTADVTTWAAVLVLQPAEFRVFEQYDPSSPCEFDESREAFADERRLDAARLMLVPLPVEWKEDPLGADAGGLTWRSRLAHLIFTKEVSQCSAQQVRFNEAAYRWETLRREAGLLPWELVGLPLALLGTESIGTPTSPRFFLDRAAVVRPGGKALPRTRPSLNLDLPDAGTPSAWRARADQFAEQLRCVLEEEPDKQAAYFRFLPPAGLLPRSALKFLNTADAKQLSTGPIPDRVDVSRFFPESFAVKAAPVPVEDLDAVLAASAALAPYDLGDLEAPDQEVRLLVPLPQRLFDPQLLIVEQTDAFFPTETNRLLAQRQEWRQRRNFVRRRLAELQADLKGGAPACPADTAWDPEQLEAEPVETSSAVNAALVSPLAPTSELRITLKKHMVVLQGATLYLRLQLDGDHPPSRIELCVHADGNDFCFGWSAADFPLLSASVTTPTDSPTACTLMQRWELPVSALACVGTDLHPDLHFDSLSLKIEGGRVAIGSLGVLNLHPAPPGPPVECPWWPDVNANASIEGFGGDWVTVEAARLLAPFEGLYSPTFSDNATLEARLDDLDTKLGLSQNGKVRDIGLERLVADLKDKLAQADDAVDLSFLKLQTNVHRIRQVVLGEEVANELLTSPVLSSIVNVKSARVAQAQIAAALKANQTSTATLAREDEAGTTKEFVAAPNPVNVTIPSGGSTSGDAVKLATGTKTQVRGTQPDTDQSVLTTPYIREDIIDADAGVGTPFELRTLTFAKRFDVGPTRNAFESADAQIMEVLGRAIRLDLGYDEDTIPEVTDDSQSVTFKRLASEGDSLLRKLTITAPEDGDGSKLLATGVRRADTVVLILRRLESYIARRREQLRRAQETLAAVQAAVAAAANRLLVLEGKLAEARHDVSVARALWAEEVERVNGINTRRDDLLRDEVTFLAYVRPRACEAARRDTPGWRLDAADAPATIPTCLQRTDEPPDDLRAYVQLFRQAPAAWFTAIAPRLGELNTHEKLFELLDATRLAATQFTTEKRLAFTSSNISPGAQAALAATYGVLDARRQKAVGLQVQRQGSLGWSDLRRLAKEHTSLGDLIDGRHGHPALARAAATELEHLEQVATGLHAEFAAVAPAIRLRWVEQFSQFDRPESLRDLTALPRYGSLPRDTRRRFQEFVDWLFGRVISTEADATSLINQLVRICLLLASHAPVKRLIIGTLTRPTTVRTGSLVSVKPIDSRQVRVGMQVQVWQGQTVMARGQVADLRNGEAAVRVDRVVSEGATLDPASRVQFIAPGLIAGR